MFRYAYNSLVYYGEKVETSIERVARFGYDAIELYGEPQEYDPSRVKKLCEDRGITVSSICSLYTDKRDLASPDRTVRQNAIDYVKQIADFAAGVGCPVMIVAPTACMKMTQWKDPREEWKWAVESIRMGGEHAGSVGVNLAIEAWNRYETYLLNRLDQCLTLLRDIGLPNAGVMGDTFHMNIEEESIAGSFRTAGRHLNHVHLADSNRAAPGKGHIDFLPVLQALKDIGYGGYLSFELLPAAADPFGTLKKGGGREFFDEYTKTAISYIKDLEKRLA
jgi:sugar phosphate isomerase/epimerase